MTRRADRLAASALVAAMARGDSEGAILLISRLESYETRRVAIELGRWLAGWLLDEHGAPAASEVLEDLGAWAAREPPDRRAHPWSLR